MTVKGDRWGRDRIGRSAPAFLAASTTALPHLPALHGERQANFVCGHCFAARPAICCRLFCSLCRTESPLAVSACSACSAGCVPVQPLPAMPTALNSLPPFSCLPPFSSFLLAPVSFHVRQDQQFKHHVCKLRELSRWQLQHGPAVAARAPGPFDCFFFLQSP